MGVCVAYLLMTVSCNFLVLKLNKHT